MVKNILIANVGIFILQALLNLPLSRIFGLRVVLSDQFAIYQFFTYMWIHGGFGHLLGNMFAVFIFGPTLENVFGAKRFLTFYLVCGIGAGVLYGVADFAETYPVKVAAERHIENPSPESFYSFVVDHKNNFNINAISDFIDDYQDNPNDSYYERESVSIVQSIYQRGLDIPMVGASGAIFGILLAFGYLFPNTQLFLLFPPIPIKAKYFVLFYGLYELYAQFNMAPGDNVAHLAHLSGMLIAFILLKVWQVKSNRFY